MSVFVDEIIEREGRTSGFKNLGSRNPKTSLDEETVYKVKVRMRNGERNCDIARDLDIRPAILSGIRTGKYWSHVILEDYET